jgi:hypothetical protein
MNSTLPNSKVELQCPACQSKFLAPKDLLGRTGRCSKCRHEFPMALPNPIKFKTLPCTEAMEWVHCSDCLARTQVKVEELGLKIGCRSCGGLYRALAMGSTPTRKMSNLSGQECWSELIAFVHEQKAKGQRLNDIEDQMILIGVSSEIAHNAINDAEIESPRKNAVNQKGQPGSKNGLLGKVSGLVLLVAGIGMALYAALAGQA